MDVQYKISLKFLVFEEHCMQMGGLYSQSSDYKICHCFFLPNCETKYIIELVRVL